MRKTWFRKGVTPYNKGVKQEEKAEDEISQFHYIRPSHSEVSMARQDPLGPQEMLAEEESKYGGQSTMLLRTKPDAPLEVEKKNSDWNERQELLILHLKLIFCMFRAAYNMQKNESVTKYEQKFVEKLQILQHIFFISLIFLQENDRNNTVNLKFTEMQPI